MGLEILVGVAGATYLNKEIDELYGLKRPGKFLRSGTSRMKWIYRLHTYSPRTD